MKLGVIKCLFILEDTADCIDNITIILFSSFNISNEKSCSSNVQRLLFVFTTSFRTKNLRDSPNVYLRAPYNFESKQLLFSP